MEKYLDETIHSGSTGWTTLITVYHLYKCDNDGTCQSRMDIVDYAGLFLVSSDYLKFDQGREMLVLTYLLSFRYFTLFLIYTPYTIYQCKLFICGVPVIDVLPLYQMDSRGGGRSFSTMVGDVRQSSWNYETNADNYATRL